MKINSKDPDWLKVKLEKNSDWSKGIIIDLPNNKRISVSLATRETAVVHFSKMDNKGNYIEEIDSFAVNDKMEWYDPNSV